MILWFLKNRMAVNFLKIFIICLGLIGLSRLKIEVFPPIALQKISVSVDYPGGNLHDIDQLVVRPIEEALRSIEGVEHIESSSYSTKGVVVLSFGLDEDMTSRYRDIKQKIDVLSILPEDSKSPVIKELISDVELMNIALYGDISLEELFDISREIKEEILQFRDIDSVVISGGFKDQIVIDVLPTAIDKYKLDVTEIIRAIDTYTLNMPLGAVGGEVIRLEDHNIDLDFYNKIPVLFDNGHALYLESVANILYNPDLNQDNHFTFINDLPGFNLKLYSSAPKNILKTVKKVKTYLKEKEQSFSSNIKFDTWLDYSVYLKKRLELLINSAGYGFILIFLCLFAFLAIRMAFWTAFGILFSFVGSFFIMDLFDISINLFTLFAFIVVLGIVVDDAIIISENIFRYKSEGKDSIEDVAAAVKEVALPVLLTLLTTMCMFMPLLGVDGVIGQALGLMPYIVVGVLLISMIEVYFILPSHLALFSRKNYKETAFFLRVNRGLEKFIERLYLPFLKKCLKVPYLVLSIGIAVLILFVGIIGHGWIRFSYFPGVETDYIGAQIAMHPSSHLDETKNAGKKMGEFLDEVLSELNIEQERDELRLVYNYGQYIDTTKATFRESTAIVNDSLLSIVVAFPSDRSYRLRDIAQLWQTKAQYIPGLMQVDMIYSTFLPDNQLEFNISMVNEDDLSRATEYIYEYLEKIDGVVSINDSITSGLIEYVVGLNRVGQQLNINRRALAQQISASFLTSGIEKRYLGKHEVSVEVRLDKRNYSMLRDLPIIVNKKHSLPLHTIATIEKKKSLTKIGRRDRQLIATIIAEVDTEKIKPKSLEKKLKEELFPKITENISPIQMIGTENSEDQKKTLTSLLSNTVIALFGIYVLLALFFKSYLQPLLIMAAIPFGLVGALIGHWIIGMDVSVVSFFGFVALSGVVVNDALVLMSFYNAEMKKQPRDAQEVWLFAAKKRFRPVIITTLTTFVGLAPILFETSMHAQFLKPMAASLAFGVLFATMVTLILVPCIRLIFHRH